MLLSCICTNTDLSWLGMEVSERYLLLSLWEDPENAPNVSCSWYKGHIACGAQSMATAINRISIWGLFPRFPDIVNIHLLYYVIYSHLPISSSLCNFAEAIIASSLFHSHKKSPARLKRIAQERLPPEAGTSAISVAPLLSHHSVYQEQREEHGKNQRLISAGHW
jgi:hypothetical protein